MARRPDIEPTGEVPVKKPQRLAAYIEEGGYYFAGAAGDKKRLYLDSVVRRARKFLNPLEGDPILVVSFAGEQLQQKDHGVSAAQQAHHEERTYEGKGKAHKIAEERAQDGVALARTLLADEDVQAEIMSRDPFRYSTVVTELNSLAPKPADPEDDFIQPEPPNMLRQSLNFIDVSLEKMQASDNSTEPTYTFEQKLTLYATIVGLAQVIIIDNHFTNEDYIEMRDKQRATAIRTARMDTLRDLVFHHTSVLLETYGQEAIFTYIRNQKVVQNIESRV